MEWKEASGMPKNSKILDYKEMWDGKKSTAFKVFYDAIDIVETKLKNQLKKYKETHSSLKIRRRLLSKGRNGRIKP